MLDHHLAQVNLALPKEPLDSPLLRDFVAALEPVNAAADASPGFVWRLQTEDGDATAIRAFDDDRLIINMSVWESLEALRGFVYRSGVHLDVLRHRRDWFECMSEAHMALWWIPVGSLPSIADAEQRVCLLREHGPSQEAFTFRTHFPPPAIDNAAAHAIDDDRRLCPSG